MQLMEQLSYLLKEKTRFYQLLCNNNKGTIKAKGITKQGGKIFLSSKKGKIKNSGTMVASSEVSVGGKIEITGDHITLKTGSVINVTGKKVADRPSRRKLAKF